MTRPISRPWLAVKGVWCMYSFDMHIHCKWYDQYAQRSTFAVVQRNRLARIGASIRFWWSPIPRHHGVEWIGRISAFGFLSSLHTMSFTFSAQLWCHVSSCGPRWNISHVAIVLGFSSLESRAGTCIDKVGSVPWIFKFVFQQPQKVSMAIVCVRAFHLLVSHHAASTSSLRKRNANFGIYQQQIIPDQSQLNTRSISQSVSDQYQDWSCY